MKAEIIKFFRRINKVKSIGASDNTRGISVKVHL